MGNVLIETERYKSYFIENEKRHEALCKRCGRCCGALNDPCRNLVKLDNGRYLCRTYRNRLGKQSTVSGKPFTCIHISKLVAKQALPTGCAYSTKRYNEHIS